MIRGMMFSPVREFTLTIAASVANPNIPTIAAGAGWNGTDKLLVDITAPYVNTINLLSGWSFPGGIEITISASTLVGGIASTSVAGAAITASVPVSIRNNGTIAGGGGFGGGGETLRISYTPGSWFGYGTGGTPGPGQGFRTASATTPTAAAGGGAGVTDTYAGTLLGGDTRPSVTGGNGGAGATWGNAGTAGASATASGSYSAPAYTAGTAASTGGKSIVGNTNITWLATGTRLGAIT